MSLQRINQSSSQSLHAPSSTSQFAPRPFSNQELQHSATEEEIESNAFQQNKFEAFGLQLKEKHGKITPVEQERLGMLQAKMNSFWAQQTERPKTQPNLLEILTRNAQVSQATELVAPVQPKLTVGEPNDPYEQEADRVAEQVMSMPESAPVQRVMGPEEVQTKPLAATITPLVQRAATLEEEKAVQAKSSLQRATTDGSLQASSNLESRLNSSKGGGSPLPQDVKDFMESRFRTDFSQVRAHTDSEAVQMNRDLNAQAFTHQQDVYFGAGKSPGKDALTAHELTHVVQQQSDAFLRPSLIQCSPDSDDYKQGYEDGLSGGEPHAVPRDGDALTDYNEGYGKGHYKYTQQSSFEGGLSSNQSVDLNAGPNQSVDQTSSFVPPQDASNPLQDQSDSSIPIAAGAMGLLPRGTGTPTSPPLAVPEGPSQFPKMPFETSSTPNTGQGVAAAEGTGTTVAEGTGTTVAEGTGTTVAEGTGTAVAEGTGTAVVEGTGTVVAEGTGLVLGVGVGAMFATVGAGLATLLYSRSTAPAWMDEMNPTTGKPYSSKEEYDQVHQAQSNKPWQPPPATFPGKEDQNSTPAVDPAIDERLYTPANQNYTPAVNPVTGEPLQAPPNQDHAPAEVSSEIKHWELYGDLQEEMDNGAHIPTALWLKIKGLAESDPSGTASSELVEEVSKAISQQADESNLQDTDILTEDGYVEFNSDGGRTKAYSSKGEALKKIQEEYPGAKEGNVRPATGNRFNLPGKHIGVVLPDSTYLGTIFEGTVLDLLTDKMKTVYTIAYK